MAQCAYGRQRTVRAVAQNIQPGADGSFQRWCDGGHHHHLGAGAASATRRESCSTVDAALEISGIRAELHLHWHLLEQPPPFAALDASYRRRGDVGKPPSALLAFAHASEYRLGWQRSDGAVARSD